MRSVENPEPRLTLNTSRMFTQWLAETRSSLAVTTYQAGKIFFLGHTPEGGLSVFERTFPRSMGLAADGDTLWMASLYQLWRFRNVLGAGEAHQGHDALYLPLEGRTTGDLDIHDVAIDADGRPVFVATLFNCLATLDDDHSFQPIWTPPFIDRLAAEDRCHLNGLAMVDGLPAFATAVATTNVAEAWREHRQDGGVLIEVPSGEIVCTGLSMPHSPRAHAGRVWLLNAGTGEFGFVDPAEGRFEPVAFCPGFLRGLTILSGPSGDWAVIGLSRPRGNRTFDGLALGERLAREGLAAQCGLRVVNLQTGDVSHALEIEGVVEELYDVVALKDVRRPMALGFRTSEIRTRLSVAPMAPAVPLQAAE